MQLSYALYNSIDSMQLILSCFGHALCWGYKELPVTLKKSQLFALYSLGYPRHLFWIRHVAQSIVTATSSACTARVAGSMQR